MPFGQALNSNYKDSRSQAVVKQLAEHYQITNINRIKPSIAEATRAILRRVPDLVLLRDANDADTALLRHLTEITHTPVQIVGDQIAPYRAITPHSEIGSRLMLSALSLGATLYMPATRPDLWQVVNGEKYPELRSLVICLEDAVSEHEVEAAKVNLKHLLQQVQDQPRQAQHPKIFIRPRHIAMAEELAQWQELIAVDGMVLPKFCLNQLRQWQQILPDFIQVMPTLEDAETFDMGAMRELRQALQQDFRQVLVLRIGGNDLPQLSGCAVQVI